MKQLLLSLLEDAYRLEQSESEWYRSLAARAAHIVPGEWGAMAYSFDASAPEAGVRIDAWGAASVSDSFVEGTLHLNRATTPEEAIRFYHHGVLCGTVSEMIGQGGQSLETNPTYANAMLARGHGDTFGLTASSPSHRGMVINAPLSRPTSLNPRAKLAWRQAGVHLHAAFRLRESVRSLVATPEAVVEPGRGVVHSEGVAKGSLARERLHDAARAVDSARSRSGPSDAADALEMWRGLVSGRWTLIETFESDGRRYFLAYPNEITPENPRSLTPRERAVVGHIVQGDSNKWIAYQLGIKPPTVARHLTSGLRKIGLRHRHELIWLYHSLHRSDRSNES